MTTDLAISSETIGCYLDHVVLETSLRAVAKCYKTDHPSTVLRRVQTCEGLRENPEWDAIFKALEGHIERFGREVGAAVTRSAVVAALGCSLESLHAEISRKIPVLRLSGALVLVGGNAPAVDKAAIMVDGGVRGTIPRTAALAAIALGWLKADSSSNNRKVRAYRPTSNAVEAVHEPTALTPHPAYRASRRARVLRESPISVIVRHGRSGLTDNHLRAAQALELLHTCGSPCSQAALKALETELCPRFWKILKLVCLEHVGLEEVERRMNLPARSAKALIALGLETLIHKGLSHDSLTT